ncbi:MAG: cobalt-precorrin-6A reductase [Pseudomonadota bacterium]
MTEKILILGGTKEATRLAEKLVGRHGNNAVITSLAGRTKEPKPVAGAVRIGGFGGVKGLCEFLRAQRISKVIDATHPFAEQISANAVQACRETGTPLAVHARAPWARKPGDMWIEVASLKEAREKIPVGATVLLAIGSQHLSVFENLGHATLIARTVDGPAAGLEGIVDDWITGRPSPDVDEEARMLTSYAITHIVCRNSGGDGAYAKIKAARALGMPVIMVQRPRSST